MKISVGLPQTGSLASVAALDAIVELAEARGAHGLWVVDRLLAPLEPRDPYPASSDGRLPAPFARTLDPLQLLAAAAARTSRLRIGTNVLVMPWYNPVMLARTLSTLDVLSGGRLDVGLGLGWSRDEVVASGAAKGASSAARTDEFVDVLRACLRGGEVEHTGAFFAVPTARIDLVPASVPPLFLAAFTPGAMARVARRGDGWLPSSLPFDVMMAMWAGIRQMAEAGGRDPDELRLIVRGNTSSLRTFTSPDRPPFEGDLRQLADDVRRCEDLGVHEVILDLQFTECAASLRELLGKLDELLGRVDEYLAPPIPA